MNTNKLKQYIQKKQDSKLVRQQRFILPCHRSWTLYTFEFDNEDVKVEKVTFSSGRRGIKSNLLILIPFIKRYNIEKIVLGSGGFDETYFFDVVFKGVDYLSEEWMFTYYKFTTEFNLWNTDGLRQDKTMGKAYDWRPEPNCSLLKDPQRSVKRVHTLTSIIYEDDTHSFNSEYNFTDKIYYTPEYTNVPPALNFFDEIIKPVDTEKHFKKEYFKTTIDFDTFDIGKIKMMGLMKSVEYICTRV
jgi:hypothetical protein